MRFIHQKEAGNYGISRLNSRAVVPLNTSLLPQLSVLFTPVLEAGLFPSLGKQKTKNRWVVHLLEMVCVYHLWTLDPIPLGGFLNALPLPEALRMLIQAKKACSPTAVPWFTKMAVGLHSIRRFAGFTSLGDQTCWISQYLPVVCLLP